MIAGRLRTIEFSRILFESGRRANAEGQEYEAGLLSILTRRSTPPAYSLVPLPAGTEPSDLKNVGEPAKFVPTM
ncbi:hypothetical protein CJU94_40010 (plasmid) [Paraburkholderia aromaticivorans]|uniref:Uncharacterized protein n=1 Tax=Paraburkholderia aromaticivorans TaxID=2026199 RepID=A0A248W0U5_9BURK|nr:hypothetical protein CJU94_40010 [Paraburkholderia aromaticivorans]